MAICGKTEGCLQAMADAPLRHVCTHVVVQMNHIGLLLDCRKALSDFVLPRVSVAVCFNVPPIKELKVRGRQGDQFIPTLLIHSCQQARAVGAPSSVVESSQESSKTSLDVRMSWFKLHYGSVQTGLLNVLVP